MKQVSEHTDGEGRLVRTTSISARRDHSWIFWPFAALTYAGAFAALDYVRGIPLDLVTIMGAGALLALGWFVFDKLTR